ncbi:MAG: T9SS type A sorting domain-containing protein, partial [Flavobacterium sp.]
IKIYFSKGNALGSNIANSGDGGALYFGGGNVATRSFVINLSWGDFLTSGGFIFAEYNNGTAYKSSNITVIKNSTVNSGTIINPPADAPNPNKIVNTICCDQTIRLGDKPAPITGSQYLNPYKGKPYGIDEIWTDSNGGNSIRSYDDVFKIPLDYITESKGLTVIRRFGYPYGDYPNKSNVVTIKVIPTPIINEIVIDGGKDIYGFVEIIDANPKQIYSERSSAPRVNLKILEDPYHIQQRGDNFDNIERYEWEYAKTYQTFKDQYMSARDWIILENKNSASLDFSDLKNIPNLEDSYLRVRRIAFYKNISNASNIIKIIPRTLKDNNVICCDQVLAETSSEIEKPSIITGSTPFIKNQEGTNLQIQSIIYQWQSQSISNDRPNIYGAWSDISGATSKDYLPLPLQYTIDTRGGLEVKTTYNYRRISTIYYVDKTNTVSKSYSNEINVRSGRIYGPETLIAYPNPASSIIYIENKGSDYILANTQITITNTMGVIVNSNNFSTINQNLISIDVSNLIIGTYFINIKTGVGSRDNRQLTFIKSN